MISRKEIINIIAELEYAINDIVSAKEENAVIRLEIIMNDFKNKLTDEAKN